MINNERLTIVYSSNCGKNGTELVNTPKHRYLYTVNGVSYWQDGKYWEMDDRPDRLRTEILIDKGFPMSIVSKTNKEGTRYNVLLQDNPQLIGHLPDSRQVYTDLIDRPESIALLLANYGKAEELERLVNDKKSRSILTPEEILELQKTALFRRIEPQVKLVEPEADVFTVMPPWPCLYKGIISRVVDQIVANYVQDSTSRRLTIVL